MGARARLLPAGQAPAELMAVDAQQDARRGRNDRAPVTAERSGSAVTAHPQAGHGRLTTSGPCRTHPWRVMAGLFSTRTVGVITGNQTI
jgi:hypothetical protein